MLHDQWAVTSALLKSVGNWYWWCMLFSLCMDSKVCTCVTSLIHRDKPRWHFTKMNNQKRRNLPTKWKCCKEMKIIMLKVNFEWRLYGLTEENSWPWDHGSVDTATIWQTHAMQPEGRSEGALSNINEESCSIKNRYPRGSNARKKVHPEGPLRAISRYWKCKG